MSANPQDVEKFVTDFTAAEKGPNHDFHNAVQDLMKLQGSVANKQEFQQAMVQFNSELIKNGALPPLDVQGNPQALIVGADKNGNFLLEDRVKGTMQERNGTTFQTMAEQPMSEVKKGNWGAIDQGQNNTPSGNQPGDGSAAGKPGDNNGAGTQPSDTNPAPQATPGGDGGNTAPSKPGEVKTETWGKREFQVAADGSAEYSVKSGDTVWSVASDVLKQRSGKQPSAAEIEGEINKIAAASGLNKNGRNPGLIYANDKLVIPGDKPAAAANPTPGADTTPATAGGNDAGSRRTAGSDTPGVPAATGDGGSTGPARLDPYRFDGSPTTNSLTGDSQTQQPQRRRSPFDPDPNLLLADNGQNGQSNDATG